MAKKIKPTIESLPETAVWEHSLFTELDIYLFKSGKHFDIHNKLGSHLVTINQVSGCYFAVWAPNAIKVAVIGSFNGWNAEAHVLNARWDGSGIWEGFIPNVQKGDTYKYKIYASLYGQVLEKGDPYAIKWEHPPHTASIVWEMNYAWNDQNWIENRPKTNSLEAPISVYEVHMGSWKTEEGKVLTYKQLAEKLIPYLVEMEYTHVEFMPVMEHPYTPSWGYQITGYFAPTARFGEPEDFAFLVDQLHQAGIGVYLDWVPSHYPGDAHGLFNFDGTHLYEHADPRKGYHPDWQSYIFNYGRNEVKCFLISNAMYWVDRFHADGLRVDAVASMLYLDYSRNEGEWIPNAYGGRENLEAIALLKEMNENLYGKFPGIQTIAEESTAFEGVSKPTFLGGLGFGMKWMMGWMHDTLKYLAKDSFYRKYHQDQITFSILYAFSEQFMLPLSHDEVVHGKGSLLTKMPGDEWQRFANLRMLHAYMYAHPGAKLLFMGGEFGQPEEWRFADQLSWDMLQYAPHKGVQSLVKKLNQLYKSSPELYELQFSSQGFEWIDGSDAQNSVIAFLRKGKNATSALLIVCNFTPVVRQNYTIGLPEATKLELVLNTDDNQFWGSGFEAIQTPKILKETYHNKPFSTLISLPPLAVMWYKVQLKKTSTIKSSSNKKKTTKQTSAKNEK